MRAGAAKISTDVDKNIDRCSDEQLVETGFSSSHARRAAHALHLRTFGPRENHLVSKLKIKLIVGSTRANRFSEKPSQWMFDLASARPDFDLERLDLRDYEL